MNVQAKEGADARILDCGHPPSAHEVCTTGYGTDADGRTACYVCCAQRERAAMLESGRATLYLSGTGRDGYKVGNWTGTLVFPYSRVRRSPRAGGFGADRTDVWFIGPDGAPWHGINRGDNQILRCRRLKGRTPRAET